jgi:hypothetical protein
VPEKNGSGKNEILKGVMTVNSTGQPGGIIIGHGLKKVSVAEDKKAVRVSGYITGNGRTLSSSSPEADGT